MRKRARQRSKTHKYQSKKLIKLAFNKNNNNSWPPPLPQARICMTVVFSLFCLLQFYNDETQSKGNNDKNFLHIKQKGARQPEHGVTLFFLVYVQYINYCIAMERSKITFHYYMKAKWNKKWTKQTWDMKHTELFLTSDYFCYLREVKKRARLRSYILYTNCRLNRNVKMVDGIQSIQIELFY